MQCTAARAIQVRVGDTTENTTMHFIIRYHFWFLGGSGKCESKIDLSKSKSDKNIP